MDLSAFVDTASAYLTLQSSWKLKLWQLIKLITVTTQLADQTISTAEIYGPVLLRIQGFEDISTEVLLLDIQPDSDVKFEPLLGYIPLEQANATVDMTARKLVALKHVDLK